MKIQVLGTGCHNCIELERRLADAIAKSGRSDVTVERIDEERIIRQYIPLEAIPGLVIDGRLICERQVPDVAILLDWLRTVPAG